MSTVKNLYLIAISTVFLLSSCDSEPLRITSERDNIGSDSGGVADINESVGSTPGVIEEDDAYWAELAQDYPAFVAPPEIGAAHDASENINLGRWGDVIEWPQIATGAANLPDGRLLTWSASKEAGFGGTTTYTHGSIFDPETETFTDMPNENQNMFCAGISMLADGSVFTAGGGATITTTSIFDGNSWSLTDSLNTARWYPQSTTLPSGQVVTSLGSKVTTFSELWTQGEGWRTLSNANLSLVTDDKSAPNNQRNWFPALNVAPDGSLFHPGPTSNFFSLDLYTNGASIIPHGKREAGDPHRIYNTTVMYDIGKMLVAGGGKPALNTALTIDINGTTPVVSPTEPMTYARSMQDSIVLPNGKVLVIGGNSSGIQFSDEGTQLFPEIWDPQTGQWQTLAPHRKPRNYHSTAMLLKDGRVAAMGSGLCGNCATNQQNGEIFEPPYLFNADGTRAVQPQITSGPDEAVAGDALSFAASPGMQSFSMVRLVALTHHHTTDQRFVPLGYIETSSGDYEVQLPANPNVLIPGYYWVFALDVNGVPTEGHTLMINPTAERVPEPPTFIAYDYYEGSWDELPEFDSLTPVASGASASFGLGSRQRNDNFAFLYTATISLASDGTYTFFTNSDDGSQLFVNGALVVNNDGAHRAIEKKGTVDLSAGTHEIVVTYFEKTGDSSLLVQMQGPTIPKQSLQAFLVPLNTSVDPVEPTAPASAEGVITYDYYEGNWNRLPDFDALTPVTSGELASFTTDPKQQDQFYGFRYTTTLYVPDASDYTFYITSDDGSALYVNGALVVDNDGLHGSRERQSSISLAEGQHDIVVEYFQRTGGETLAVHYESASIPKQVLLPTVAPTVEPVDPQTPDSVLANGAFGSGLSDWSACGGDASSGNGEVELSADGCLFQEFTVTPGASYTLSCDAAVSSGFASIQLGVSDSDFASLGSDNIPVTSTELSPVVATLTAADNSAQGVVTLYAETQARFDNCVVVEDASNVTPVEIEPVANDLLVNATFTNNLDGWFGCGGEQTLSTDGLNGGQAVVLSNSGCLFQEFTITPGSENVLSCIAKSGADFSSLTFASYDSGFNELDSQLSVVTSADYQSVNVELTAADNARYGVVTLYADTDASFDSCGVVSAGGVTPDPLPAVDPADNLLSNGDFANDDADWLVCGGTSAIDTVGIDGSNAITLGASACIYQEFDATPGAEYGVSCAGSATGYASMTLGFLDSAFNPLANNEATVPGATLSSLYVSSLAPAATARGTVTLYADEAAVFDDCAVVEL